MAKRLPRCDRALSRDVYPRLIQRAACRIRVSITDLTPSRLRPARACAGLALACAYSSSDEYEAELIQARREAGAYGSRHHRQAYVIFALAATAIVVVFFAI